MSDVLARRDRALSPEETEQLLRDRLGEDVVGVTLEFGVFTLRITPSGWSEAVRRCRDEPLLAFDMFDNLFGVDARDEGFDVVVVLYSTSTGNRIVLRTRCEGGREAPTCPSITEFYRGANWMERETWDMFGIEFVGHPGLEPRLLTVENFEGWPLRKDFALSSRAVKPWPGVKEPAELDEDGNVVERVPRLGDAPGPYELDKAMAEQAKRANPAIEPANATGEAVEDEAARADEARDSGRVLSGDVEQDAEDASKHEADAEVDVAGEKAENLAADAAGKAEQRRRDQAAARARKAAERRGASGAGEGPSDDGEGSA